MKGVSRSGSASSRGRGGRKSTAEADRAVSIQESIKASGRGTEAAAVNNTPTPSVAPLTKSHGSSKRRGSTKSASASESIPSFGGIGGPQQREIEDEEELRAKKQQRLISEGEQKRAEKISANCPRRGPSAAVDLLTKCSHVSC